MTQKELLYFEDAYKHEDNLIKIIDLSKESLENDELKNFMNTEKEKHEEMKQTIKKLLEAKSNEWYNYYGKLFISTKK